jgi:hypothetical protein
MMEKPGVEDLGVVGTIVEEEHTPRDREMFLGNLLAYNKFFNLFYIALVKHKTGGYYLLEMTIAVLRPTHHQSDGKDVTFFVHQ